MPARSKKTSANDFAKNIPTATPGQPSLLVDVDLQGSLLQRTRAGYSEGDADGRQNCFPREESRASFKYQQLMPDIELLKARRQYGKFFRDWTTKLPVPADGASFCQTTEGIENAMVFLSAKQAERQLLLFESLQGSVVETSHDHIKVVFDGGDEPVHQVYDATQLLESIDSVKCGDRVRSFAFIAKVASSDLKQIPKKLAESRGIERSRIYVRPEDASL